MSLILPIVGLAAGTLMLAQSNDRVQKARLEADSAKHGAGEERPIHGRWQPYSSISQNRTLTINDVKRVTKSTDVRGVPVFLVDYVGGARVIQYFDPFEGEIQ